MNTMGTTAPGVRLCSLYGHRERGDWSGRREPRCRNLIRTALALQHPSGPLHHVLFNARASPGGDDFVLLYRF